MVILREVGLAPVARESGPGLGPLVTGELARYMCNSGPSKGTSSHTGHKALHNGTME